MKENTVIIMLAILSFIIILAFEMVVFFNLLYGTMNLPVFRYDIELTTTFAGMVLAVFVGVVKYLDIKQLNDRKEDDEIFEKWVGMGGG